ncbi:MAG: ABC transporter substrate-binding protein [Alphaproteobacteria bacterium]|nr:ABC transporter substrate-binding protein [Alphaproteobacteria bacterium]
MALRIVTGTYGLTRTLKENPATRGGLDLEFIEFDSIPAAMRRQVRNLEFDVCEMALTTYLCARAAGKPIVAIPVFVTRNFHHWAAFRHINAGIHAPKDIEGRQVAVNRGYTVTTGLWVRGALQHEYGVDLDRVTWLPTDEEHVAEYRAPANVDYRFRGRTVEDLMLKEGIAAAVGDVRSNAPEIKPLIPDAREAGFAYYRKTGIYPINHMITISRRALAARPTLARELFEVFKAAKAEYLKRLAAGGDGSAADRTALALKAAVGDPFPYGVAANRKALEAATQFCVEQHMTRDKLAVEPLFASDTLMLA